MAKICLISFDLHTGYYPSFHHGLAYLIGALKRDNHRVSFRHLIEESDYGKTIGFLKEESPDIIGLSFTTNQKKYVREFLSLTTQVDARLIVAGGAHVTLVKDEIFKDCPEIDGICIGEGEIPLMELCQRLDNNKDYFSVPSFYFKTNEGIVKKNPVSPLQDIDSIVLPDYTLYNYEKVIKEFGNGFPMLISRGCPFNCSYCSNHMFREIYPNKNDYVRFPSVQQAINIIKNNLLLYTKTEKVIFNDDILVLNKKWLSVFCDAYKKEIGLPFVCNARVETTNDDVVRLLKDAGCTSVSFGVESGNEWLRKNVLNRRYSNKAVKEAFRITRKHGIKSFSYNIIGLPFETKEMAKDTLKLNLEIRPDYGKCFYFYPYPRTVARRLCESYNLFLDDLEAVSGILESPSVKDVFMKHSAMKKYCECLNVLFYSRLLFSKIHIPFLFEKLLLKVIFILRKPILMVLDPNSSWNTVKVLRRIMRRYALKYIWLRNK